MKCNSCKIVVEKVFSFAIKNNQCPACGKHIMPPEKLAAYISLQELIKSNFSDVDAEKVANLVVANFELKQLFKESAVEESGGLVETDTVEVSEDEMTDEEYDEIHKLRQVEEARAKLKRMKEEAYEDALRDQYGMGEIEDEGGGDMPKSDGFFGDENMETAEIVNRMKGSQKQEVSQNKMLSGTGGFSRSDA
jgi:hypothetical protein